jgi:hypothetical protein
MIGALERVWPSPTMGDVVSPARIADSVRSREEALDHVSAATSAIEPAFVDADARRPPRVLRTPLSTA